MLPPKIDRRDIKAFSEQLKEMVPYYTPEWRFTPEDPDPGTALFLLFADMFEENVRRLNRVPFKNFIAFLNLLNISQLAARPARAQVTFRLSEGVRDPVSVPAGTQLTAEAEDGEIVFETERSVLLTPARLSALFEVSNRKDLIREVPSSIVESWNNGNPESTVLFRQDIHGNLQQHVLYLAHDSLFLLERTADVKLEFGNSTIRYREQEICRLLADPATAEWLYATEEGWTPFDKAVASDNRITLRKQRRGEIAEMEIDGQTGRWIACRLKPSAAPLLNGDIAFDRVAAKTDYFDMNGDGGLPPDRLFAGDVQGEQSGVYPFGEFFAPLATFYISSREGFSKRKGKITLHFHLRTVPNRLAPEQEPKIDWKLVMKKSQFDKHAQPPITITTVVWEYWNGNAWVRLETDKSSETMFVPGEEGRKQVKFECPADLEETFVNAEFNYWIRVRVLQIENLYNPGSEYMSPWIENVAVTYGYGDLMQPPERVVTLNNTAFENKSAIANREGTVIRPFGQIDCKYPSYYFGFDAPPVKGPIHMYMSIEPMKTAGPQTPLIEWEYWSGRPGSGEWKTLKVLDETNGLTQSGTLQFAGPYDFAEETLFGRTLYWIRAANRDAKYDFSAFGLQPPVVNGIFMNTTRVVQQESVLEEVPVPAVDGELIEFKLDRTPIVSEWVWVDETGELSEEELQALAEQGAESKLIRDSEGNLQRAWLLWRPVDSLNESKPKDRHYVIDRNSGKLIFGDGVRGMAIPDGGERIRASYKVSGGKRGNVGRKQIASLRQSIAFVQAVDNPVPSAGGCDAEALEEAVKRGPQLIKHRDRAVTASDFEWMARQAYPNIAKVKCLANVNVHMEREIGAVSLVVLTKDGLHSKMSFAEMKREVEKYILHRAPNVVAFPANIQVVEPVYLEISVHCELAVTSMDEIVATEISAVRILSKFLDPLTGNYDGKGWQIGQQLHVSVFYGLLKSIPAVNHVEKLYMSVDKIEDGRKTEIDARKLGEIPHGIVLNGMHHVNVQLI